MTASSQCPHLEFSFQVNVARFENDTLKMADISGRCVTCAQPLVFRCAAPMGINWSTPTLSPDAQELRVPMAVLGDDVDEGKRRPSFSIKEMP